mmetsp:Transcript_5258/g.19761  ORF Transcript_5258/g.19761 Transcript_5258/m.19761 type:complete len:205 (+) Transcript_5258:1333-1947(+)
MQAHTAIGGGQEHDRRSLQFAVVRCRTLFVDLATEGREQAEAAQVGDLILRRCLRAAQLLALGRRQSDPAGLVGSALDGVGVAAQQGHIGAPCGAHDQQGPFRNPDGLHHQTLRVLLQVHNVARQRPHLHNPGTGRHCGDDLQRDRGLLRVEHEEASNIDCLCVPCRTTASCPTASQSLQAAAEGVRDHGAELVVWVQALDLHR